MFDGLLFDIDEPDDESRYDVILVDGMNVLHRAAHSHQGLSVLAPSGAEVLTGAAFGFFRIVMSVWEKYAKDGTKLTVCWDGGYKHRTDIFPDYKANRRNKDPSEVEAFLKDLPNQRKALGRILAVAGWAQAIAWGFEADDVMATMAREESEKGKDVAIYTMDQDMHQCVTEKVHVVSPKWGSFDDTIWSVRAVTEKWGLPPTRVHESKALAGDKGDNIPGCPGCGKGWAKKLLANASLPEVLEKAKEGILTGTFEGKNWRTPSLTQKILDNSELILISWELAKTVDSCEVQITHLPPRPARLRVAFDKLQFEEYLIPSNFQLISEIA